MKIYTAYEVAKMLKIDHQTVLKWLREGKIKYFKLGNNYRITDEMLKEFIEKGKSNGGNKVD